MKVNTFEKCLEVYKSFDGWESEHDVMRAKMLEDFQFNIIVEGVFKEHDQATLWCEKEVGNKDESWTDLWYYKTEYDYGFWEFGFKKQEDAEQFEKAVPTFLMKHQS